MSHSVTRRALGTAAVASLAVPFIARAHAAAPIELRVSLDSVPSHPRNKAFHEFLSKIEAASAGAIKTRLFESGSLFPDLQVAKAVVQGQIEMACPGTWTITGFVPDADFSELPAFYARPIDVVHRIADGKVGTFVNAEITSKLRVEVLGGWLDLGYNHWFSTHKPITSLEDLRDMKLRSPGGVLHSWRIRFFGGIPNVTAWPNVPLAISQGMFDGLISSNDSTLGAKLFDSGVRHSLQDHQGMGLYVPMANQRFWARIGPKMQEMIRGLWAENLSAWRTRATNAQEAAKAKLVSHGIVMTTVSQAELDAVRARMLPQQAKLVDQAHMTPDLVKLVLADAGT